MEIDKKRNDPHKWATTKRGRKKAWKSLGFDGIRVSAFQTLVAPYQNLSYEAMF